MSAPDERDTHAALMPNLVKYKRSMSEPPLRYAVLLARPEEFNPSKVAEALAAFGRIALQDAARLSRGAWGIPAQDLGKEAALSLQKELRKAGVESLVLPQNLLEEIPAPAPAGSLEFLQKSILARLKSGAEETLAMEDMRLIAAMGLKQTVTTTVRVKEGPGAVRRALGMGLMLAGLPPTIGVKSREAERKKQTTELFFYLDLCLKNPDRRVRVDAQDFNFACLKARMGYAVSQNFRTLTLELLRLCPRAARNRGAQVLLDGSPVASMGYDALADLDREIRWLVTLDSLKNP